MTTRRMSLGSTPAYASASASGNVITTSTNSASSHTRIHDDSSPTQLQLLQQYESAQSPLSSSTTIPIHQSSLPPPLPPPPPTPPPLQQQSQQIDVQGRRRPSNVNIFQKISRKATHVRILRLAWCGAVLFGERLIYNAVLRRCYWPADPAWPQDEESIKEQFRIAIIADPQLTDWFSYKQKGIVLALVEFYTDLFMSRSFNYFHYIHRPDAVLFLGDLMDGGRETIDQEVFNKNLRRFHRIFQTQRTAYNTRPVFEYITKSQLPVPDTDSLHASNESTIGADKVDIESPEGTGHNVPVKTPVQDNQSELYRPAKPLPTSSEEREQLRRDGKSLRFYMAGNHDIGFGDTTISTALHTYRGEFGPLNYELDVGNHRLVVLDTLALSAKTKNSPAKVEAQHLLDQIGEQDPRKSPPRILFTHVPLYRPPHTFCGDERETKPSIEQGRGLQFQNLVEEDLSQEILQKVQPRLVLSGDDHDWCRVLHTLPGTTASVAEVTVPTFSFAQGVLQPGLVMLNLYNPSSLQGITGDASNSTADATTVRATEATIALRSCMLPIQLHIYFSYAAFLALTLAWTLIQRYRWLRRHSLFRTGSVTSKAGSSQSFSDEDDIPDSFDAKASHLPLLPIASDTSAQSLTLPSSSFCLLSRLYWQCVWNDVWYIATLPLILYVLLLVL